jgi:glycosyltransferase involved in cell wall biosynthesis
MKIDLWIPSLFESNGGIQAYSGYFLAALQSIAPTSQFRIFLKHDLPDRIVDKNNSKLTYYGSGNIPLKLRTPAFALQILQKGFQDPPDLIIATHLNFTSAAWYLKKFAGIPYWTVAHGIEAWNIQNTALQTALKHADRILPGSYYTRDRLLKEQQLDRAKIFTLPNTFDSDTFQIGPKPAHLLQKYGLTSSQPIILTVARLETSEQYKGYDKILTALPQIRQAIPDVHYLLVGKGGDRARIERLIADLDLQDCVTLAGFVPDGELIDHYNLCDVFAMPSKGEGFGIVYLEALACGKPTLGGNRDGAIDALCHGELGALVNPDDVDEIAQTLVQILQGTYPNPLMYQPELLRAKVIDIYGFDRFQQTLANLIDEWHKSK